MIRQYRITITMLLSLLPALCSAELMPQSYASDQHIQVVSYNPNQVYRISSMQGYTTAIELSSDEKIISVNIGDSSAWLVNVQNNIINLKPVANNPDTNMNVITSRGSYQFFLTAPTLSGANLLSRRPTANTIFLLRFTYPDTESTVSFNANNGPVSYNLKYSAHGDRAIAPVSVFDDGHFTYFDFTGHKKIPAIFLVDNTGNEAIVNYHVDGKYIVVETIGRQFTLRDGGQVASIFNEAAI